MYKLDIPLFFNDPKGITLMGIILLTLILFVLINFNKIFKSIIIAYSLPVTFCVTVGWFFGGALYADLWRFSRYGSYYQNIPLPQWFDGASWGFAVAGVLLISWLIWVNKAVKIRDKNYAINFNK